MHSAAHGHTLCSVAESRCRLCIRSPREGGVVRTHTPPVGVSPARGRAGIREPGRRTAAVRSPLDGNRLRKLRPGHRLSAAAALAPEGAEWRTAHTACGVIRKGQCGALRAGKVRGTHRSGSPWLRLRQAPPAMGCLAQAAFAPWSGVVRAHTPPVGVIRNRSAEV